MVTVKANKETGEVVVASGGEKGWGYLRVESETHEFSESGIVNMRKRSCLIKGPLEVLNSLKYTAEQQLSGKIVYVDSLQPTNPMNLDQDKLINPKTQQGITSGGKQVYRTAFYDASGTKADVKLEYDKVDTPVEATASEAEDNMEM